MRSTNSRLKTESRVDRYLLFWEHVLIILAAPVLSMFMLHWLATLEYDTSYLAIGLAVLVLLGSLVMFVWGLCQRDKPWRWFRVWVTVHLGLFAALGILLLMGPVTPPEPGTMRCGNGQMILLLMLPVLALGCALGGWFFFGVAKSVVEKVSPQYYTSAIWGGASSSACGEGSLTLIGDEGCDASGGLSFAVATDGQLSLEQ